MSTDVERLRRLHALYGELADLTPAARAARLEDLGLPTALRAELEALLADESQLTDGVRDAIDAAVTDDPESPLPPHVGPWRVLGRLGEGGMGVVLLAERDDGEFRRRVALKVIRGFPDAASRERMRRERQVLAGLEHPHIARLYDGGSTPQGEPWLAMEYVEGERLAEWLARGPTLRERLRLFAVLCRAVHFAHQRLVLHCDLKPANVMVRPSGEPVLLDFGIARLLDASDGRAATQTFMATPAYASPEQLAREPLTSATDVFALGVVLFELCTGSVPLRAGPDTDAGLEAPSRVAARSADPGHRASARALRGDIDRIVRRATRRDPTARYASAAELAGDVEAWLDGRPVLAAGAEWRYLAARFIARHRLAVGTATLALLALVGLTAWLAAALERARKAEASATLQANTAERVTGFFEDLFEEIDPRRRQGATIDARELLDQAQQRANALAETAPEARGRLLLSLARIELNLGRHERAERLVDEARSAGLLDAATPLARQLRVAETRVAAGRSRWQDSATLAGALVADARAAGDAEVESAALLARAIATQTLGQLDAASDDLDAAQALFTAMGDADGLHAVTINRAIIAEYRGQYGPSLAAYEQAQAASSQRLGPDHPSALDAQFGRAKLLNYLARTPEALAAAADLADRCRRVFGVENALTQRAMAELAVAQHRHGDYAAAVASLDEALRIARLRSAGQDDLQASNHLSWMGAFLHERGDLQGAWRHLADAYAIRVRMLGADAPRVAFALHALARIALDRGDLASARHLADRTLAIRRARLPGGDPWRLMSEALALEIDAADATAALPADAGARLRGLQEAIPRGRDADPRPQVAVARAASAVAWRLGDLATRLAALREELSLRTAGHAPAHAVVLDVRLRLAQALADAGDPAAAVGELAAVDAGIDAAFAADAPQRRQREAMRSRLLPPARRAR